MLTKELILGILHGQKFTAKVYGSPADIISAEDFDTVAEEILLIAQPNSEPSPQLQQTHVSRSPLFGIFSFAGGRYVGYWSSYEAAEQVMHDEYNDDEWYVDELVCQDCG